MSLKYFLSGASGIRDDLVPEVAALIPYRLLSMHEAFKGNTKTWCNVSHHPKSGMQEVMLDSGAFTAFMKGKKVKLDDLIATYKDTLSKLDTKRIKHVWFINLDVIPGKFGGGHAATPDEIKSALAESDENYKVLKKHFGDRVLPVYHQTEGTERLKEVAAMSEYIALGFRQDFSEESRVMCAEEVVDYTHKHGVRTHGLATTGGDYFASGGVGLDGTEWGTKKGMFGRVPFDSVDSATWLYIAAMGGILYLTNSATAELKALPISNRSPMQKDNRGHFKTVSEDERNWIRGRMVEAGVTFEQLEADLSYRILFCAHEMREWMRGYKQPEIKAQKGLFGL